MALALAKGTLSRAQIAAKHGVTLVYVDYTRQHLQTKAGQERIFDPLGRGRRPKLSDDHIAALTQLLDSDRSGRITAAQAKGLLIQQYPELATVAIATISVAIKKRCHRRWVRSDTRPPPVLTAGHREKRVMFARLMLGLYTFPLDFVYIDEYSMKADDVKPYSWKRAGEQHALIVPHAGRSYGMMAAVTKMGLVHLKVRTETNKARDFIAFLSELKQLLSASQKHDMSRLILYADGARIHTAKDVDDYCAAENLRLIINISYTPEFNPAEAFILHHKMRIRAQLLNRR